MTSKLSPEITDRLHAGFNDSINRYRVQKIHTESHDDQVRIILQVEIRKSDAHPRKSQLWEVFFDYPTKEASSGLSDAEAESKDWFYFMLTQHIIEWWATREKVAESSKIDRRIH